MHRPARYVITVSALGASANGDPMEIKEAIILAGGLGTRLRSEVSDVPKPMAPIAGRPFLEFVLTQLIQQGFERVILSVGYKSECIIDHFGDSWGPISLAYCIEDSPLGTGGAMSKAFHLVKGERALVLNGDTPQMFDVPFSTKRLTPTVCFETPITVKTDRAEWKPCNN